MTREISETICSTRKEPPILVGDLFRQATLQCITQQFVQAAIATHPGLESNYLEKMRLQQIAGHMAGLLRCAKRNPNREVFTLTETNFSQYCTLPQYISNSYISCKELFADVDISFQAKVNRTCVLVLMAILKDELP